MRSKLRCCVCCQLESRIAKQVFGFCDARCTAMAANVVSAEPGIQIRTQFEHFRITAGLGLDECLEARAALAATRTTDLGIEPAEVRCPGL